MRGVLTDEEIRSRIPLYDEWRYGIGFDEASDFARAIEAAVLAKFGEPVAWSGMTGHGAVISVNPPAIQPDNWTPLYALKDKS